jgi:hypothetical protein
MRKHISVTVLLALVCVVLPTACAGGKTYKVDPGGTDDTAAIQSAIDEAMGGGPGGIVSLGTGEFTLSGPVSALNFCGTLRGAGRERTTIRVVPGTVLATWPDPDLGPVGAVFALSYDGNAPCDLRVEGLTLEIEGQSTEYATEEKTSTALKAFYVRGLSQPRAVNTAWTDLAIRGGAAPSESPNLAAAVALRGLVGDHAVSDALFEAMANGIELDDLPGSSLAVGGRNDRALVTFRDMDTGISADRGLRGVEIAISHVAATNLVSTLFSGTVMNACSVTMASVETEGACALKAWACEQPITVNKGACASEPSEIRVKDSTISQRGDCDRSGVEVMDNGLIKLAVEENLFHREGVRQPLGLSLMVNDTRDAIISSNRFTGRGYAALMVGEKLGADSGTVLDSNDFAAFEMTALDNHPNYWSTAPLRLGPQTSNITVTGSGDWSAYVYDSTDNRLTAEYDGKNTLVGFGQRGGE